MTLNARLKAGCFLLEGLNSFATTFFFYYLYFYMHERHGFGDKLNLLLAAFSGIVYAFGAVWAGRVAQRAGYFTALKIGLIVLIAALGVGTQLESAGGQVAVLFAATLGMCFTWPALEALVSEGEAPFRLARIIGLYNVVWAGLGALAYFTGGAMLETLGLKSLFVVPIAIQLLQLALTIWLEREAKRGSQSPLPSETRLSHPADTLTNLGGADLPGGPDARQRVPTSPTGSMREILTGRNLSPSDGERDIPLQFNPRPIARARAFLRMAWLSNPFAYIAINTLVAVMPGVAQRLELSTRLAGFYCSVWCFARLGAFFVLWFWPGWHYKFRWLLAAHLALIASFVVILIAPNLAVIVLAQLAFGGAIGLIYYSSLFYSMDVGEAKGEHGGIHEAAIGLGNFAGPAVGALWLHFWPLQAHGSVAAVGGALVLGLFGLLVIQYNALRRR